MVRCVCGSVGSISLQDSLSRRDILSSLSSLSRRDILSSLSRLLRFLALFLCYSRFILSSVWGPIIT